MTGDDRGAPFDKLRVTMRDAQRDTDEAFDALTTTRSGGLF
jgi:hypothetical protein